MAQLLRECLLCNSFSTYVEDDKSNCGDEVFYVCCANCGFLGPSADTSQIAIEWFNTLKRRSIMRGI